MALTYRGAGTIYESTSSNSTGALALPSGLAVGDIVIAQIARAAAVAPNSVPAGWALLREDLSTYGCWTYYQCIQSVPGTGPTFGWAANAKMHARLFAYYAGVAGDYNPRNPVFDAQGAYATASGTTIPAASITTAVNNTPLIYISSGYSTSARTHTPPSSNPGAYTENVESGTTTSDFWFELASMTQSTAGATGAPACTIDAAATSTYRRGLLIALNPGAAPTGLLTPQRGWR